VHQGSPPSQRHQRDVAFHDHVRLILVAACVGVALLLLWQLSRLLLLVFAAVLVGIMLRGLADLIARFTPLGRGLALLLASLTVVLVLGLFVAVLGVQIRTQAVELLAGAPEILRAVEARFGIEGLEDWLTGKLRDVLASGAAVVNVAGFTQGLIAAAADVLLVVVAGIYFAARPHLYREGILLLFPRRLRGEAEETLELVGRALRLWLVGQLVSMILVGTLIGLGLWFLGVPSALALGFLAGLIEFVPFVGPVLGALPGVATALAQDGATALWALGLYVLVQQIEGNLITPLVQQRAVDLPPALTIFAIVAFATLFGPLGLLLATPLAVVCFVAVKKLWVRDVLAEETEIPGEPKPEEAQPAG